jgi:hypothetical protein
MGVWDTLSDIGSDIGSGISDAGSYVYDAGASAVDTGVQLASDAGSYIASGATTVGQGIADGARAVGGFASDTASAAYHGLTDWHFEGRAAHNGAPPPDSALPTAEGAPNADGWQLLPEWMSVYHDDGVGAKERKYINSDGREAVRDGDTGAEVTDPRYMATYNYVNPMSWDQAHGASGVAEFGARSVGHFAADVLPYWFGGNVRGPN